MINMKCFGLAQRQETREKNKRLSSLFNKCNLFNCYEKRKSSININILHVKSTISDQMGSFCGNATLFKCRPPHYL